MCWLLFYTPIKWRRNISRDLIFSLFYFHQVFVEYANSSDSKAAQRLLTGRTFDGKFVVATFYPLSAYKRGYLYQTVQWSQKSIYVKNDIPNESKLKIQHYIYLWTFVHCIALPAFILFLFFLFKLPATVLKLATAHSILNWNWRNAKNIVHVQVLHSMYKFSHF